jgi:hypothetical protein
LEEVMSSLFNNTQGAAHTPSMIDIYLKDGTVIHSLVDGFDMDDTTTIGTNTDYKRFAITNENISFILEV